MNKIPLPTSNITELNELNYAGAKLSCDKTGVSPRNPNRNIKKCMENWARRTG